LIRGEFAPVFSKTKLDQTNLQVCPTGHRALSGKYSGASSLNREDAPFSFWRKPMSDAEVLSQEEVQALGLPQHCPGTKDELEWSRIPTQLECATCGTKVARTLEVPPGVTVGKVPFSCATCNGKLAGKSAHHGQKPKRGRPRKTSPQNGQEPQPESIQMDEETKSPFQNVLIAALAPTTISAIP
jgi:hypothetical protein